MTNEFLPASEMELAKEAEDDAHYEAVIDQAEQELATKGAKSIRSPLLDDDVGISPIPSGTALSESPDGTTAHAGEFTSSYSSVMHNISEIPQGVLKGVQDGAQNLITSAYELATGGLYFELLGDTDSALLKGVSKAYNDHLKKVRGAIDTDLVKDVDIETSTGQVVAGISKFITGMAFAAGKIKKFIPGNGKMAEFARMETAGMFSGMFALDPHEERLSNFINELAKDHPQIANSVTEYLAADKDDPRWEGRMKEGLEGLGMAPIAEGFVQSVRALKYIKRFKRNRVSDFMMPEFSHGSLPKTGEMVPVIKAKDGTLYAGKHGKTHDDLIKEADIKPGKYNDSGIGFMAADGMFLTRRDVSEIVAARNGLTTDDIEIYIKEGKALPASGSFELDSATLKSIVALRKKQPLTKVYEKNISEEKVDSFLHTMPPDVSTKDVAINMSRLDSVESIDKAFVQTQKFFADEIDEAKRFKIANDTIAHLADDLGMTVSQLLETPVGKAMNAEELLASRKILVSSGEALMRASVAATQEQSPETLVAFYKQLQLHVAIQTKVTGAISETGRAMNSLKILAASAGDDKVSSEILADLAGVSEDNILKLAEKVSMQDTLGALSKITTSKKRATMADMALEFWVNGLLSGPQTHAVNTLSNSGVALWRMPERFFEAGVAKFLRNDESAAAFNSAVGALYGTVQGFKAGMAGAGKVMWSGEPIDPLTKIELRNRRSITGENVGKLPLLKMSHNIMPNKLTESGFYGHAAWGLSKMVDFAGGAVRVPGRLLMAEDELFRSIGYYQELYAQGHRSATIAGKQGKDFGDHVQRVVNEPPESIKFSAMNAGRYQTFTKPLGQDGRALQGFVNRHPVARLITPFIRTPINIFKYAGERTPLALFSKSVKAELEAGGPRANAALAKMATGSMIGMSIIDMTLSGSITGGAPLHPDIKASYLANKEPQYSIKVGDTWYSYARLEPAGTIFGIAADLAKWGSLMDQEQYDDAAFQLAAAITNNLHNKTFIEGLLKAATAVQHPDRYGKAFIDQFAGSLVPNIAQTIKKTGISGVLESDMTIRSSAVDEVSEPPVPGLKGSIEHGLRSALNTMLSKTPGFSKDFPPWRNLRGDPVVLSGGLGPDWISPIWESKPTNDPIGKELVRMNVPVGNIERTISGVQLSPQEYDELIVKIAKNTEGVGTLEGMTMWPALNAVTSGQIPTHFAGQYYSELKNDDIRQTAILEIISMYKGKGREEYVREKPDVEARIRMMMDRNRKDILGEE